MAEAAPDSWEDEAEPSPPAEAPAPAAEPAPEKPKMNPFASSFNPNAGAFVPSWMKKEEPAAPSPAAEAAPKECVICFDNDREVRFGCGHCVM